MLLFAKAHAYGNDFLYVSDRDLGQAAPDELAREMCDRHLGIGADGLIVYHRESTGAAMRIFNADGGRAEVSGNGVRALGALLLRNNPQTLTELTVRTDGGTKVLRRITREGNRQTFRAAMGVPSGLGRRQLEIGGRPLDVVVVNVGNPQCVVLGPLPGRQEFERLGAALERHGTFPEGTNVEFVEVEEPARLRILIWERGVGPTTSSGTGSCASLVAAAAYGGAARDAEVMAPGGPQRVEWQADGIYLTGWAEVLCEGRWLRPLPVSDPAPGGR